MKAEIKPKTIHYRRATFLQGENNLQKLLTKALRKLVNVGDRMEGLMQEDHTHRFINSNTSRLTMLFGSLIVYAEGTNKPLVTIEKNKSHLDVEQIAPPSADGKKREFLDSILYFGIKDNHILLLQSSALKARQFEAHLFWLLHEAGVLNSDDRVSLDDYMSRATKSKIETAHVKKVRVGALLETTASDDYDAEEITKVRKMRYTPTGKAFEILKTILGDDWLKGLKLSEALDDSRLQVALEVSYSYTTTQKSQKLLDNIANSLRHIDQDDIRMELNNGSTIKGKELKLSSSLSINTHGGVVDESDLYPKMHKWLLDNLNDGIIDV